MENAGGVQKGIELNRRLSRFGAHCVRVTARVESSRTGRHLTDQLIRSATAPGAHYAEARGAQSARDFIYKVALALKELQEARHWLWVLEDSYELHDEVAEAIEECGHLERILAASKRTAQSNLRESGVESDR